MKEIILILVLVTSFYVATGQNVTCLYHYHEQDVSFQIGEYICKMKINNPDEFNNFTEILGLHDEGMKDDDVIRIVGQSNSKIFPSIVCEKYKNIIDIYWLNSDYSGSIVLEKVDKNSFKSCKSLSTLVIQVDEIGENAFEANLNLYTVKISGYNLKVLPKNIFSKLERIRTLHLTSTSLTDLSADIFESLINLEELHLISNKLRKLIPTWFKHLAQLKQLSVESDQIRILNSNVFDSLVNLKELILQNSSIFSISTTTFKSLKKLEYLDLKDNHIYDLPLHVFDALISLKKLTLTRNGIEKLKNEWFLQLKNLETLMLDSNKIMTLPENVFDPLEKLKKLNLTCNWLQVLHSSSFGRLKSIDFLDARNNEINAIDPKFFGPFVTTFIYIEGNFCSNIAGIEKETCIQHYETLMNGKNVTRDDHLIRDLARGYEGKK